MSEKKEKKVKKIKKPTWSSIVERTTSVEEKKEEVRTKREIDLYFIETLKQLSDRLSEIEKRQINSNPANLFFLTTIVGIDFRLIIFRRESVDDSPEFIIYPHIF